MRLKIISILLFVFIALVCSGRSRYENADYSVSGTLNPDATGHYFEAGTYDGEPYYRRVDGAWFIWFNTVIRWNITETLGSTTGMYWQRYPLSLPGNYNPYGGATGVARVSIAGSYRGRY